MADARTSPDVTFDVVDPLGGPAMAAVARYVAEIAERMPGGFRPGDPRELSDAAVLAPPHGFFVLGTAAGVPVACGGVRTLAPGIAEIKRMWVDPDLRGVGLGRRLLAELESRAAALGHRTVRLDSNSVLVAAQRLYERAGYRPIERYNDNPYPDRFYEKHLVAVP